MEKVIKVQCNFCGNEVTKELREYKRRIKNKKNIFYCNTSCAMKERNKLHPPKGNPARLVANNRKDQYTPFRWFVLRAQYRDRKKQYGCNLTVEFLKKLWEKQKGICPLTGWKLELPTNTGKAWEKANPCNASLDRINNDLGYIEGNVRYIALMANLARQAFSDEELIAFCKAVMIRANKNRS